ncbi:hypothetical protein Bhyg_05384 [Pseudolycoriella hygida]|uniref:Uncharacterized protein n=1 Tax=Pseudolycoriella hygida TaxID=35572 RepID=A0A9Q0SAP2_9DIPT|nr:hypothetical protein Bhyg_05384 [Pseudolycoriella hygida]
MSSSGKDVDAAQLSQPVVASQISGNHTLLDKISSIESRLKSIEDLSIEATIDNLRAENIQLRLMIDKLKADLEGSNPS